jgi:hypothetical protein
MRLSSDVGINEPYASFASVSFFITFSLLLWLCALSLRLVRELEMDELRKTIGRFFKAA